MNFIESLDFILGKIKIALTAKSDVGHSHSVSNGDITDFTAADLQKISKIITNGNGTYFLSNNGSYIKIDIGQLLTEEEKQKLTKLSITGDGTGFLSNDGTYKSPFISDTEAQIKLNAILLDGNGTKFLSDNGEYKESLSEDNKTKLNTIVLNGDGTKCLSNNGTYVASLSPEQSAKLSKILTNGAGLQFLSDNGQYKMILTQAQLENINSIIRSGDGTKFLADNGQYLKFSNDGVINDLASGTKTTYSSSKLTDLLQQLTDDKADKTQLHDHPNKELIDDITLDKFTRWEEHTKIIKADGNGESFLANNGHYVSVAGLTNPINNDNKTSSTTALSAKTTLDFVTSEDTKVREDLQKEIDKKQNAELGKSLSKNDYTDLDKDKVDCLKIDGNAHYYLSEDGTYYEITNSKIDDVQSSQNSTYSSSHIDSIINDGIKNIVLPTQNDAPTMWQRSFDNVKPGHVLELDASLNYQFTSAIIQVYKHIAGEDHVVKQISNFTPEESHQFFYNPEMIEFTKEQGAKIKDCYSIPVTPKYGGYFESEVIHKEDYLEINNILLSYTESEE